MNTIPSPKGGNLSLSISLFIHPFPLGISLSSKNIKKSSSPRTTNNNKDKKYKTVEKDNKKIILADLTKGLLVMKNIDLDQEEFYTENIRDLIESADLEEYNQLLIRVLKKHVQTPILSPFFLTFPLGYFICLYY